jgi:hypothetical protein
MTKVDDPNRGPLMILVAGPARGGTVDEPQAIARNIDDMTRAVDTAMRTS